MWAHVFANDFLRCVHDNASEREMVLFLFASVESRFTIQIAKSLFCHLIFGNKYCLWKSVFVTASKRILKAFLDEIGFIFLLFYAFDLDSRWKITISIYTMLHGLHFKDKFPRDAKAKNFLPIHIFCKIGSQCIAIYLDEYMLSMLFYSLEMSIDWYKCDFIVVSIVSF